MAMYSESVGYWEGTPETTVCFGIEIDELAVPIVERLLGELSYFLRQDCIAMLTVTEPNCDQPTFSGQLIGPVYGETKDVGHAFEMSYFVRLGQHWEYVDRP